MIMAFTAQLQDKSSLLKSNSTTRIYNSIKIKKSLLGIYMSETPEILLDSQGRVESQNIACQLHYVDFFLFFGLSLDFFYCTYALRIFLFIHFVSGMSV